MDLKSLRNLIAVCLLAVSAQGWATVSLPQLHGNASWNDISSIAWSTDSGATWGQSALTVGQIVQFQVTLHKTLDGRHYADFVKTWVDWGRDGAFDASDVVIFDKHVVNSSKPINYPGDKSDGQSFVYESSEFKLNSAMIGSYDLLARVTCSESLLMYNNVSSGLQWSTPDYGVGSYNDYFQPLKYFWQGEAAASSFTVNGQNVPEPGTLALFAAGVAGLGFGRKRMNRV